MLVRDWKVYLDSTEQSRYRGTTQVYRVEHRLVSYFGNGTLCHPFRDNTDLSLKMAQHAAGIGLRSGDEGVSGMAKFYRGKVSARIVDKGVYEFTIFTPYSD